MSVTRSGMRSVTGIAPAPLRPATAPEVRAASRLERTLAAEPTSFSFFQAVRLLSLLRPGRAAVGHWADPTDEVARFSASTSLAFPASEIQALELPERAPGDGSDGGAAEPARMLVNFFGLTGPQGVLPHVYTEHAAARARVRDTAFRDFLDIFHHRSLSLFYRAWEKHRAAVIQEAHGEDRLSDHLLDLAGLGTPGLRDRLPMPDEALGFYAGLLAQRGRPAEGLARLVGDYFDVPAQVEQFTGAWRRVEGGGQCTLGAEDDAGRLGFGVMGDAAWDAQSGVRLRLGPLTREQYDAFLPGGSAHETLRALARLYVDGLTSVDAQLVLSRDAIVPCTLGAAGGDGTRRSAPLGRGTWLASRPLARDPDETTMRLCE